MCRFMGKKIRVRPAPEPSDVIWENLESTSGARFMRSVLTALATLAFLGTRCVLFMMWHAAYFGDVSLDPRTPPPLRFANIVL